MSGVGDRASTRFSSSREAATGEDPPPEGDPQTAALAFWKAVMDGKQSEAEEWIAKMSSFNGGVAYAAVAGTLIDLSDVLPTFTSGALSFWHRGVATKLMLLDPKVNCCAVMNKQDTEWFAACTKLINVRRSALACTTRAHRDEDRRVITSAHKIYTVVIPDGQNNKVFSRYFVRSTDLPAGFQGSVCEGVLLSVAAPPYVWLNIIELRPSPEELVEWGELSGRLEGREESEEEDDDDFVAATSRGLDPSSHGGDTRGGSTHEPQAMSEDESSGMSARLEALSKKVELLESNIRSNERKHQQERAELQAKVDRLEDGSTNRAGRSQGVTFEFDRLSEAEKRSLARQVLADLDYSDLADRVAGRRSNASDLDDKVEELRAWRTSFVEDVKRSQDHFKKSLEELEASKDSMVVRRAGIAFSCENDVAAMINLLPGEDGEQIHLYNLDMMVVLYLLDTSSSDYEDQIQAMAAARKAGYSGALDSKVALSYACVVPPTVLKKIEGKEADGGTKWAPMFSDPSNFEKSLGKNTATRIEADIDKICDLHERMIESKFPLNPLGQGAGQDPNPIWHNLLLEQARFARSQAMAFVQSLLPMYKTFTNSGMGNKESWDRVHVFAREVLRSIQAKRIIAADMAKPSQMLWGSFQSANLAEEFRKAEFIQHPMVSSLMCLISLEREGKGMAEVLSKLQSVTDVNTWMQKKMEEMDTEVKALKKKK